MTIHVAQVSKPFAWVELFAGNAQATMAMRDAGLRSARLDILYRSSKGGPNGNSMDICSDVGLATLGQFAFEKMFSG